MLLACACRRAVSCARRVNFGDLSREALIDERAPLGFRASLSQNRRSAEFVPPFVIHAYFRGPEVQWHNESSSPFLSANESVEEISVAHSQIVRHFCG
jgi:hypothetical protein